MRRIKHSEIKNQEDMRFSDILCLIDMYAITIQLDCSYHLKMHVPGKKTKYFNEVMGIEFVMKITIVQHNLDTSQRLGANCPVAHMSIIFAVDNDHLALICLTARTAPMPVQCALALMASSIPAQRSACDNEISQAVLRLNFNMCTISAQD